MKLWIPVLVAPLWLSVPEGPATSDNPPEVVERLRAHYAAAESELRARDESALTPEQRSERHRLLDALAAYRERGVFGVDTTGRGVRTPTFVDATGRRCAVAQLLHASGEEPLIDRVARADNDAWIAELSDDAAFQRWLVRSGLSLEEAARIQAPAINSGRGVSSIGQGGSSASVGSGGGTPSGGSWTGPGDTVPGGSGPSTSGGPRSGGGGGGASSTPSGSGPGATAGTPSGGGSGSTLTGPRPSTPTLALEIDDGWWLWWEYNKAEFVRPNRLGMWSIAATGDGAAESWRNFIASTRTELATAFVSALDDGDAAVRRASVDAIAKLGGDAGVPHLVRMLDDKSLEVRHHAILALGASGSPDAIQPLLAIMRRGHPREGAERISPIASAVAIVALGLGQRAGFEEATGELVAQRVRERSRSEREAIGCGAMLYQRLAPCAELEALALELAADHDESPAVRCRAIEALTSSHDPKVLAKLQHHLSAARLDERRSAALALGAIENPLALPALQTAYELEGEPLTRGFVLVSIGRRGGEVARKFLLDTAAKDDRGDRHWVALALGLLARQQPDPAIPAVIRAALKREKSREVTGAYWLALGLARDLESRGLLREALASGADARARMYAATALALIGDPESALIVRDAMRTEPNASLRVAYASSLSQFGVDRDAPVISAAFRELKDPSLQGLAASALAFHGTRDALGSLREFAREDQAASVPRAAAIEGLSIMLGSQRPYTFSEISRQANYTVFSDWLKGMLQVSL